MCLYTKATAPKIAKKDITVYKKVYLDGSGALVSPYMSMPYKFNKRYKLGRSLAILGGSVYEGFHAYSNKKVGFVNLEHFRYLLVKAIIPKGSEFVKGEWGEIVSNQFILRNEAARKNKKFMTLKEVKRILR